jgi:hypothetical protein
MTRYARLPFFTKKEMGDVLERCERTEDGCLIYYQEYPRPGERNKNVYLRGKVWNVLRVMWSETFCFTVAAQEAFDTHDVGHISACPNTGANGRPLCVEPTHLCLVTNREERTVAMRERRAAYQEKRT